MIHNLCDSHVSVIEYKLDKWLILITEIMDILAP